MAEDHAGVAVEHDLLPILDLEDLRAEADHHRHAERAGHDGGVSGDTAAGQRHALCIDRKLRHISGTERARHQDATDDSAHESASARSGAPPQAAHVVGALREEWIAKLRQLHRVFLGGLAQGIGGGTARFHHQRLHPCRESRVPRHQGAGLDDVGLRVPAGVAKPERDLLHLFGDHL